MPSRRHLNKLRVRAAAAAKSDLDVVPKSDIPPEGSPAVDISEDNGIEPEKKPETPVEVPTPPEPSMNRGDQPRPLSYAAVAVLQRANDEDKKMSEPPKATMDVDQSRSREELMPLPRAWGVRAKYERELEEARKAQALAAAKTGQTKSQEGGCDQLQFVPLGPACPPRPTPSSTLATKWSDAASGNRMTMSYSRVATSNREEVLKEIQEIEFPALPPPEPKAQLVKVCIPKTRDQASGGEPTSRISDMPKSENGTQTKDLPSPPKMKAVTDMGPQIIGKGRNETKGQITGQVCRGLLSRAGPLWRIREEEEIISASLHPSQLPASVVAKVKGNSEILTNPEKTSDLPVPGISSSSIVDMIPTPPERSDKVEAEVPPKLTEVPDCASVQALLGPTVSDDFDKEKVTRLVPEAGPSKPDPIPVIPAAESRVTCGSDGFTKHEKKVMVDYVNGCIRGDEYFDRHLLSLHPQLSRPALMKRMARVQGGDAVTIETGVNGISDIEMPEFLFREAPSRRVQSGTTNGQRVSPTTTEQDPPATPACTCCPCHSTPAPATHSLQIPMGYPLFYPHLPSHPSTVILINPSLPLPPSTIPPVPAEAPPATEICSCVYTEATVGAFRHERLEVFKSDDGVRLTLRRLRSRNSGRYGLLLDPQMEVVLQAFARIQVLRDVDESEFPINQNATLDKVFFPVEFDNYLLIGDKDKVSSLFKCLGEREEGDVDMIVILKGEYRDNRGCLLPEVCPTGPEFLENLIGGITRDDAHDQFKEMLDDPNQPFCVCPIRNTRALPEEPPQPLPPPPLTPPAFIYYL